MGILCGGCGNAPADVRRLSSIAIGRGMYKSHSWIWSGLEVRAVIVRSEPSKTLALSFCFDAAQLTQEPKDTTPCFPLYDIINRLAKAFIVQS